MSAHFSNDPFGSGSHVTHNVFQKNVEYQSKVRTVLGPGVGAVAIRAKMPAAFPADFRILVF